MKRLTLRWAPPATLFIVFVLLAGDALACPMCKVALGSHDGGHGDLVGGFFWSILFMLSMPFVIFGSLSAYMYMLVRRARREQFQREIAAAAAERFANASPGERLPETVAVGELPSR